MNESKWICEECGREYRFLPFPACCECGNWCEQFFREKDMYDFQDDFAGRPLLGIKYAPEVLKERNLRLKSQGVVVTQKIQRDEELPTLDFHTMSKSELRRYLRFMKHPLADAKVSIDKLREVCKDSTKVNV